MIPDKIEKNILERASNEMLLDEYEWVELEKKSYLDIVENYSKEEILQSSLGASTYYEQLLFLQQSAKTNSDFNIKTPGHLTLLLEMEEIIGSKCHNKNSKSWNKFFRYEPTFKNASGEFKWIPRSVSKDVSLEQLLEGKYIFGANELFIFDALNEILGLLEQEYKIQYPQKRI
jgi:hypothetical protein